MTIVNPSRFQNLIAEAQQADFSGWDFHWLDGRLVQEEPPWDYPAIVKDHFPGVHSLLDMGTGGGELLASLAPLPPDTHATEAYLPNQRIARACLEPLNVILHAIKEGDPLPFQDADFDLVTNRHDGFDTHEVYRVLKPGGRFITQQVGGLDNLELNQVLEGKISFPFSSTCMENDLSQLYEADFHIEKAEKAALPSVFKDVGAVVYYLKAIPWQVPGFSIETQAEPLIRLHNIIERQGSFIATAHRFLILARKKEPA